MRNFVILLFVCALGVGAACSRDPQVAKRKYLASGDTYYKAAKFDEAAIEYANAVAKDPQDGDARYKLAQAYYLAGNTRAAFPQFIRAADILKDHPDVQLAAGQLLLKGGLFEDAKNRARIILQQDSASVPGLMLLGNALAGLKNLDEAVNVLERASSLDPDHVGLYTNLGVLELAQGDRSQAEAAFQKAVAVSNGSADAYLGLGNFYRATSDYERAEQALKNALAKAPQDVSVNQALASLYMEANRPADAEPYLKTVTTLAKDPQSRFALSDYYVSVERYTEAVAAIEPLVQMPDQFSPAMTRIALIQYMGGQRDKAYETIEKVLARSRRNGGALTAEARMLLADNDTDRALEAAKGAIEVDTGSVSAQLTMARILLARNSPEDARKALAEALKLDPNSLAAQLTLVEIHRNRGELDTALGIADQAIRTHPSSLAARLARVRTMLVRDTDHGRAEADLRGLLARYPRSAPVLSMQGAYFLSEKNSPAARVAFERALDLSPAYMEALIGLVAIDISSNRLADARARVETVLAKNPNAVGPLTLAGKIYLYSKDFPKAEIALKKAMTANPTSPEPYGLLAQVYMAEGKLEDAKREFQEMTKREPQSAAGPTMLGLLAYATKDLAGAQTWWEQALRIDSQSAAAANNLAWLYAESQTHLDRALELAQIAKARLPDAPEMNDTLGWVYYRKKLGRQAAQYIQLAIDKDADNAVYHFHLGMALAQTGEDAKARRSLERALSISKTFDGADEARRTLKLLVY